MEIETLRQERNIEIEKGNFEKALTAAETITIDYDKLLVFDDWFKLGGCLHYLVRIQEP